MISQALLDRIMAMVPDYQTFMTVDEMDESSRQLAAAYPDVVELFEAGRSRNGHPIYCLKIGNGSENAICYGTPHPNEPIGSMLLEAFSRILAENAEVREALDYTWYIIKAWDVDGTRLNEPWFKGPFSISNYVRHFFRPAPTRQVDWTFPLDYKNVHFHDTIPETKALQDLIDRLNPKFLYSLHNSAFGGVYWYVTHPFEEEFYQGLRDVAAKNGLPVDLGEPEAPYITKLSPAVYKNISQADCYEYYASYGEEHPERLIPCGDCSASYGLEHCDAFTLLTEEPYFFNPAICDLSESDMLRRDANLYALDYRKELKEFAAETMKIAWDLIDPENPFKFAMNGFNSISDDSATRKMLQTNPEYQKNATVAEKFSNIDLQPFFACLTLCLYTRAHEMELEQMEVRGENNPEKKEALIRAFRLFEDKLLEKAAEAEANLKYEIVPIQKLIRSQLESGLRVASKIRE